MWMSTWQCKSSVYTEHPVFLDSQHNLATLIVRDAHDRVQQNETLTELRDKYWIVCGKKTTEQMCYLLPL